MSTTFVEVVQISDVLPHPNADKLELVQIKGTQVCSQKNTFHKGQLALYFPPDLLIPENVACDLGVAPYLKHSVFNEGEGKSKCRVAATRLRGLPSYGFLVPADEYLDDGFAVLGDDHSELFKAKKYEPPIRFRGADQAPDRPDFHAYTHLEHFWKHTTAIADGTLVRITEKIHGTNSRVGVIKVDGEFQFMAGSRRCNLKAPHEIVEDVEDQLVNPEDRPRLATASTSLYWSPLEKESVLNVLNALCDGQHNVIIFGEIFGGGVQDMDYGLQLPRGYRIFDIAIDHKYQDWAVVEGICKEFGLETVPLLYSGPFSREVLEQFTHGPTTLADGKAIKSSFKGREGVVVTPLVEQWSDHLPQNRTILKSVSADYLDRRDAEDNE